MEAYIDVELWHFLSEVSMMVRKKSYFLVVHLPELAMHTNFFWRFLDIFMPLKKKYVRKITDVSFTHDSVKIYRDMCDNTSIRINLSNIPNKYSWNIPTINSITTQWSMPVTRLVHTKLFKPDFFLISIYQWPSQTDSLIGLSILTYIISSMTALYPAENRRRSLHIRFVNALIWEKKSNNDRCFDSKSLEMAVL